MKSNNRYSSMKRTGWTFAVSTVLVVLLSMARGATTVQIEGYVYDSCGGCFTDNSPCKPCTVVIGLEKYLFGELERLGKTEQVSVSVHNLLYDESQTALDQRITAEQRNTAAYPILFVNKQALFGWQQIREELAGLVLEATRDRRGAAADITDDGDSVKLHRATEDTVVYFKMQSCRSCKETQALLETLSDGTYRLLTYDLEDEGALQLFNAYCEAYGLDSGTATVPLVFIGDTALDGYPEIEVFLEPYLKEGRQATTYCPTSEGTS